MNKSSESLIRINEASLIGEKSFFFFWTLRTLQKLPFLVSNE